MKITINMEIKDGKVLEMETIENGNRAEWIAKDIDEPESVSLMLNELKNELITY